MNCPMSFRKTYFWETCWMLKYPSGLCRYEADETPQQQYLHMHFVLQARRNEAKREGSQGPRVIVSLNIDR